MNTNHAKATALRVLVCLLAGGLAVSSGAAPVRGWLNWRGPSQNGTSLEKGLPDTWVLGCRQGHVVRDIVLHESPLACAIQGRAQDVSDVDDRCRRKLPFTDLLIHEATFGEEERDRARDTGHSTAKEAAQVALASKAKRLVLSHVSARYSISADELVKEAREVFPNATVAKDGMEVDVPFAE